MRFVSLQIVLIASILLHLILADFDCNSPGSDCQNVGICSINGTCVCATGYMGDACQIFIGCNDGGCLTCLNDGACLSNGTCVCSNGYSGETCSDFIGCQAGGSLTCQNGATCSSNGFCDCLFGFYGSTCSVSCLNDESLCNREGGVCTSTGCKCKFGYTGVTCSKFLGCQAKGCLACVNGATCLANGECVCAPGFSGPTCATFNSLDTVILTGSEIASLYALVGASSLNLIYRASRDSFNASSFHAKCDAKSKTVTIVRSNFNYVFGGYTSDTWDGNGTKSDSSAYILSLRRNGIKSGLKFKTNSYLNAIHTNPDAGVTFGAGYDIYIRDQANLFTGSYTRFCASYECPSNYTFSDLSQSYLAGSYNNWLANEIEVYQVNDNLMDSYILSNQEIKTLHSMLGTSNLKLLYRASRDSFNASAFHSKCNGFAKTVSIIKSSFNFVFGGYTSVAWESGTISNWKTDSSAFLFSLRRNGTLNNEKFTITDPTHAIKSYSAYGPTFGNNYDFLINDRADANSLGLSYSKFCISYKCPEGLVHNSESENYLAGSYSSWQAREIEVFQLI